MRQPTGFVNSQHPDYVCHLHRALYGLKQAPRAWFHRFTTFLTKIGFIGSTSDYSMFVFTTAHDMAVLLLYVDDILITASSSTLLQRLIESLKAEFRMTDLGSLHYFLGVQVQQIRDGLFCLNKNMLWIFLPEQEWNLVKLFLHHYHIDLYL